MIVENEPPERCGPLVVVVDGREVTLTGDRRVVIGRGNGADIAVRHRAVSHQHAILEPAVPSWTLTDCSRNGVFVDGLRVGRLEVTAATTVSLGLADGGAVLHLRPEAAAANATPAVPRDPLAAQGRPSSVHHVRGSTITIGRLPGNDVVLDDLLVSRRHARLSRGPAGWEITDLGSGNGTFVNGRRVGTAGIGPDDVIGIGHGLLGLRDDRLVAFVDVGDNGFEARDIGVDTSGGVTLLHEVGFALPGPMMLAVIGPSGAGKSTLLAALVGSRPASRGSVRYAQRDLYADYEELRHRIALVPQDDVLHLRLTVSAALGYAARLRFPADTTAENRRERIDEVLAELELTAHADQSIATLSGGQRKRASVALELLTRPSLLFLDEPTSGLDPGMDRALMRTLRKLVDDRDNPRTVVVVTHNVANLEVCDRLLLLAEGGWLAYFGPPGGALGYFGQPDYADIFLALKLRSGAEWARRFRESPLYARYVDPPAHRHGASPNRPPSLPRAPRQQAVFVQLAVLCRRYLAVIVADRQYAIFLAALPLVLSLLARAVPGTAGLSTVAAATTVDRQPGQLLLILVIGAALMGAATAVRELVKERPIHLRERAIGLSTGAYVASKVLVLAALVAVQSVVFTVLSLAGRNPPDGPLVVPGGVAEILLAVVAVGVVSMLAGLAVSAYIGSADQGMPLLVLMIMAQLVLSGGLFAVHGRPVLEQVAWVAPARWAFAMTAATADLNSLDPVTADPLWEHSAAAWGTAGAALAGLAVVLLAVVVTRVRAGEPGGPRR